MIFNTSLKTGADNASAELKRLIEKGEIVEIKKVSQTRTSQQNRALHLFFTQVANELNDNGIYFVYNGLKGHEIEIPWTGELFKEMTWKPIQEAMFGTNSTTKLKREQIDPIFDVINKFFADKGISISFPNKFDMYLRFYQQ